MPERFQKRLDYCGNGKCPDLRSLEHGSSYSNTEHGGELQLYMVSSNMTNAQVTHGQEQENQCLVVLLHQTTTTHHLPLMLLGWATSETQED